AIVVELSDTAVRALGLQWMAAGRDGNPLAATNFSNIMSALPLAGAVAADGRLDEDSALLERLQTTAANALLGADGVLAGGGLRAGDALFAAVLNAARADGNS